MTQYSDPESQPCDKHPGCVETWRWVWDDDSTIEDSVPEIVESCPECMREQDEEDRRELKRQGLL